MAETNALTTLLRKDRMAIVDEMVRRVAHLAPHPMSQGALRDHVPELLDDISEALQQRAAGPEVDDLIKPMARKHGRQRVRHGYPIDALIREYGVLCDCILDHAAARDTPTNLGDIRILIRCVDSAIADGVAEYMQQRALVTDEGTRHLAALFEQAPGFVAFLRGADMRFELANPAYYQTVGHRELIGKPVREALPELANQGFFERLDRVYETGEPFIGRRVPIRLQRAPGTSLSAAVLDFIYQPIRDADGKTIGIFMQGHDVTAEHREATQRATTEQALRLSETRFRTLFESLDEGFCLIRIIVDEHGAPVDYLFLEANQALERHTGLTNVVGKTMRQMVPDHDAWWFEIYGRVAATGVPERFTSEAIALGRWFDVFATRSGDPAGREVAVVFTDITARKQADLEHARLLKREQEARREAEAANQLRDQFLATVSHELRTPLSAMLGWAQMLRSHALPEDKRDRALETIERNARVQAQLIEDLLDVSRILAGQLRIETKSVELKLVIDAAVDTVMPAAIARDIQITAAVAPGIGVMGDAARLQQVIWNLLSNAVKFTDKGGAVNVALTQEHGTAQILVTDTGKGIAPAFQPFVFDRFRQADGAMSRSYGGLGLGLSIVKELVHLHGGTVTVFSEGEGRGSTFAVRLPVVTLVRPAVEPRELPAHSALDCPPQLVGMRIVVVEDEPDARDLLQAMLARCGASVRVTSSSADGLAAVVADPPDLLLTDIGMPGADGYALIERVRALAPEAGGLVPAVALTAYARREDRARALNAGFDNHVAKPVDPDELLAVIATVARRHRKI